MLFAPNNNVLAAGSVAVSSLSTNQTVLKALMGKSVSRLSRLDLLTDCVVRAGCNEVGLDLVQWNAYIRTATILDNIAAANFNLISTLRAGTLD